MYCKFTLQRRESFSAPSGKAYDIFIFESPVAKCFAVMIFKEDNQVGEIIVSYETVRRWVNHFGPKIAADLRKRRPRPHTTWHLDEVYLKIDGRLVYPSIRVSGFSAFSPILAL